MSCCRAGARRWSRSTPKILPIRQGREIVRVPISAIDWIDAAGDYMCIHADGNTHILRGTMKELEGYLDPKLFQRVHRSTIVNLQPREEPARAHERRVFPDARQAGTS